MQPATLRYMSKVMTVVTLLEMMAGVTVVTLLEMIAEANVMTFVTFLEEVVGAKVMTFATFAGGCRKTVLPGVTCFLICNADGSTRIVQAACLKHFVEVLKETAKQLVEVLKEGLACSKLICVATNGVIRKPDELVRTRFGPPQGKVDQNGRTSFSVPLLRSAHRCGATDHRFGDVYYSTT